MDILKNNLEKIIAEHERKAQRPFKCSHDFYRFIGIGKRRFWQLVRNEKNLTFLEVKRLSEYFGVHFWELHDFTKKYLSDSINTTDNEGNDFYDRLGLVKS